MGPIVSHAATRHTVTHDTHTVGYCTPAGTHTVGHMPTVAYGATLRHHRPVIYINFC